MRPETQHALVAAAVFVAILLLVIGIVQPWRKRQPSKKKVTIDTTQNQVIEIDAPATTEEEPEPPQELALPPTDPEGGGAPEQAEDEEESEDLSKDKVLRDAQNQHRNQLLRSASAAHRMAMAAPTTASLMMGSIDTRLMNTGRKSQDSTATIQRMLAHPQDGQSEAEPVPMARFGATQF